MFADDMVLVADSSEKLQKYEFWTVSERRQLRVCTKKRLLGSAVERDRIAGLRV